MPSIIRWGLGVSVAWLFLTLADALSASMSQPGATIIWLALLIAGVWVGWRVAHRKEQ